MPLPENKTNEPAMIDIGARGDGSALGGLLFEQTEYLEGMSDVLIRMADDMSRLADSFKEFFEKQKFLLDAQTEKKDVKDTSGAVKQKDKLLPDDIDLKMSLFTKLFLGAILLYATGLDKWIRLIALPSTLKMMDLRFLNPIGKLFGKLFTNLAKGFKIGKGVKDFGQLKSFKEGLKGVAKLQFRLGEAVGSSVRAVSNAYRTLTTSLSTRFTSMSKGITKAGGGVKGLAKLGLTKVIGGFSAVWRGFLRLLGPFRVVFTTISQILTPLTKSLKSTSKVTGLMKAIKPFGGLFRGVFSILRHTVFKVLAPLFALFDLITGFIDGFKLKGAEDTRGTLERIFDGVLAGIIKAMKGMVIIPLDMIRKGAAWLAEKMGIDWLSDALSSFSFDEIFNFIISFFKNLFKPKADDGFFSITEEVIKLVSGLVEAWNNIETSAGNIVETVWEKVQAIVAKIREFFNKFLKWVPGFGETDDADIRAKERAKLEEKIAEEQGRIDRSKAGENEYVGFEGAGQKQSEDRIKMMERELEKLKEKNLETLEPEELKPEQIEKEKISKQTNELEQRQKDVAIAMQAANNGGNVVADVGNTTDASTNNQTINNMYQAEPPGPKANMADNPMFAWQT